ncbi:adenylate cyclase [Canicola haemoglobinophilus]|uniref:Adenylate cyclase n=1 Tax=Canicola haemoglobinophilus TaxID=733 RepID=A0AB38HAS8_9PAST|nr:class I adenylate cyclase [Canicola haemoglobinophilus]STO54975.1 adenylate cyclase [Canicola haemoglobinophilus]STO69454.1 adenylate cyclase [Canicola haemoglobinophilus]
MKYDLQTAKKQVEFIDQLRLERALASTSVKFQQVLQLITLLLHINHPSIAGYIPEAPHGIADFELSDYQQEFLATHLTHSDFEHLSDHLAQLENLTYTPILGVYVMGSIGSISQTPNSDLDIWICHREDLSLEEKEQLTQKNNKLQQWAKNLGVEINLYLMDQQRFRSFRYADALTSENSGSAQYMLLLEEFYRSVIRLAGKPLLWLHLKVENEQDYGSEVNRLIKTKQINIEDWVDFGCLSAFSANEYFGASLWQLYKGIDSPYKSVLKILLLESYSYEYPNTHLIAQEFKRRLLNNDLNYHYDPYLAMLDRVSAFLTHLKEFKRLDFVRRCFYMKASEYSSQKQENNWRVEKLNQLIQQWNWSDRLIQNLNQRKTWKIKKVKESHNDLMQYLMFSYRNLINFGRKYNVNASIMPQDISILTRKLYTAFEELPGKITLLNQAISLDLSEPHLTFIEVKQSKFFKAGWYLVTQKPDVQGFCQKRYMEYGENLNKLVAWAYFNGLLTPTTSLYIYSNSVSVETLRHFVADLRLSFPATRATKATNEELTQQCEIKNLFVTVNLTNDPTRHLLQSKSTILPSDLFSFGPSEESLVGSIDLTYRNIWNEIRTLHFEGANAILLALKVLSNKIYPGSTPPQSINVFCYSQHYQKTLRNIVQVLFKKCIEIRIGDADAPKNNMLRVAGKNWQFFFEERGLSLQEMHNASINNSVFDNELRNTIEEKETALLSEQKHYPYEMDAFASEGFLQFFFEDNEDKSFNVYILDEQNHIEIYRRCEGSKEQKIHEINQIYQSASLDQHNNPYKIVQHNFNYPQFYQLLPDCNGGTKIVPFHSRLALS